MVWFKKNTYPNSQTFQLLNPGQYSPHFPVNSKRCKHCQCKCLLFYYLLNFWYNPSSTASFPWSTYMYDIRSTTFFINNRVYIYFLSTLANFLCLLKTKRHPSIKKINVHVQEKLLCKCWQHLILSLQRITLPYVKTEKNNPQSPGEMINFTIISKKGSGIPWKDS